MPVFKQDKDEAPNDLRHGLRGSLTVPQPPLVGADPAHALDDPNLVSPNSVTPAGQATHS